MGVIAGFFYWLDKRWITYFIGALALIFVLLAVLAPLVYGRKEAFLQRFAVWVGQALTHVLLIPFYLLCFVPARVILYLRGRDPLNRRFPAVAPSCWRPIARPPISEPYKRQY